MDLGVACQEGR